MEIGIRPLTEARTIVSAWATLVTPSSSGAVQIDILKSGDNGATFTTIFSTKLTIDQDEKTSATAATPAVLSVTSLSANDILKAVIDDDGTGALGLTVGLKISETVSQD